MSNAVKSNAVTSNAVKGSGVRRVALCDRVLWLNDAEYDAADAQWNNGE